MPITSYDGDSIFGFTGEQTDASGLLYLRARYYTRRVRSLTVNTQLSNLRSQRLYSAYGFRRNGHDLPVWTVGL
jgi:hypothetical protein